MRICISINDTAQVHFWKIIIKTLESRGHDVLVLARDFGETAVLLRELNIPFYPVYSRPVDGARRYLAFPSQVLRMYRYLKDKDIDIIAGFGCYNTFAGFLLRRPDVTFIDSELGVYPKSYGLSFRASLPVVDTLVTPSCFLEDFGGRHLKVDSYKELAYLHPRYYSPDEGVYDLLGLPRGATYFLLRFNGFGASHDTNVTGFSQADKIALVRGLERYGPVFISAENGVPDEIQDRLLKVPKSRIHDVLAFARLFVTDTATMATEASILGTPSVRCSSFVKNDFGIMMELERKYGLILNYLAPEAAIEKAIELAGYPDLRREWAAKQQRLLEEKIDMVQFMTWLLEDYPESAGKARQNPGVIEAFRSPVRRRTAPVPP